MSTESTTSRITHYVPHYALQRDAPASTGGIYLDSAKTAGSRLTREVGRGAA